jgi:ferritin-like metal-binding protein YciE
MEAHEQKPDSILLPVLVAEEVKRVVFKEKKSSVYFNNHEILVDGIKQIYWSKRVLIKLLDQMIRLSSSDNLADVLEEYQVIAHRQSRRLEDIFAVLSLHPVAKVCQPLKSLINDTSKEIYEMPKGSIRDNEFISILLQFQKYWIAKGEILCELTEALAEDDIRDMLEETQQECKLLDMNLAYLLEKKETHELINAA